MDRHVRGQGLDVRRPRGSKNAINESGIPLEGATDYDFRWIVGYQAAYPSAVHAPGDPSNFNYPQYKESTSDTWIDIDSDPGRPNPWLFTSGSDQNYFLALTEHTEADPEHMEFSLAAVEISHDDKTAIPEPATMVLLGLGAVAIVRRRRA